MYEFASIFCVQHNLILVTMLRKVEIRMQEENRMSKIERREGKIGTFCILFRYRGNGEKFQSSLICWLNRKWMDEENGPSQFLSFEGSVSNFLCHLAIHLNGVY